MTDPKSSAPAKVKKMITQHPSCGDGVHTFIVTVWSVTGSAKKAAHMMCRHCLMPIELNTASQDWVVNREWLTKKED